LRSHEIANYQAVFTIRDFGVDAGAPDPGLLTQPS
jgi:hypothetical protein